MKTILIQLDTDAHPSTFDRVVAVDAEVGHIFSYGGVTPDDVESLVHGAIFTRGGDDLKQTAIFVGGSDVTAGEKVFQSVQDSFVGPMSVSVLMDSNGSNTTAAAAVVSASRHVDLSRVEALVLGGTGPVGLRSAQILASLGANVRVASRSLARATTACDQIKQLVEGARVTPCESGEEGIAAAVDGVELIISAGAAGAQFLSSDEWQTIESLKVAIDLNAVPPLGLEGIEVFDKAVDRDGVICYGAIGVGGLKMKTHKQAIRSLFQSHTAVLNTAEVYDIATQFA